MDTFTRHRRSEIMAAIRSKDTNPEISVRTIAHRLGYRFRLHRTDLPGKPDLVFSGRRAVIFVHGCFWHQHAAADCKARLPKSRLGYWLPKLQRNVTRDLKNRRALTTLGWRVLVIWECETRNSTATERRVRRFLGSGEQSKLAPGVHEIRHMTPKNRARRRAPAAS